MAYSNDNTDRLRRRYFDEVDIGGGRTLNVPRSSLMSLGKPPWELEIEDMWENVIPPEATDLVGAVVWRGVRFERSDG